MSPNILVATDGKQGARGALRMAKLLAERNGGSVGVLAVYEATDLYAVATPDAVATLPPHFIPEAVESLRLRVRAQMDGIGTGTEAWPLTVAMGPVAQTIARTAIEAQAGLILLGLRKPGTLERWFARETLLRVIHLAHVPVLAVAGEVDRLPRRVVLAIDFSDFSLRAARQVLAMVAPDAALHLAHVSWLPTWEEGRRERHQWTEWEKTYHVGVERRLDEFAAQLSETGGVEVQTHVLSGEPAHEILRLAEEIDADLISAGSHGSGFFGRIVLGSVSSKLVHGARASLLLTPPSEIPAELRLGLSEAEVLSELGAAAEFAPNREG